MKRIKLLLLAILHSQRLVQLNFKHKSNSWILNKRNQDRSAEFYTVGVHIVSLHQLKCICFTDRFSKVCTIKQIKPGRRKKLSTKLFVAEQLLSENLFNLLSVWVFESQRAGRKRRRFSLVVDHCRFVIERTDLLFNRVMHALGCLENTRKLSIVLGTPRTNMGAVSSCFHPLQCEMGRNILIW